MSRNRLYYDIGLTVCQCPCISQNGTGIPLKYSEIKFVERKNDGITLLQDARILAICKLHPARIMVNQAADAIGKGNGIMQLPPPERKDVLYGIPPPGGIRKQINNEFVHKVVVEESPQKFKGFCIMNFCQIGKRSVFVVFLAEQIQNGVR